MLPFIVTLVSVVMELPDLFVGIFRLRRWSTVNAALGRISGRSLFSRRRWQFDTGISVSYSRRESKSFRQSEVRPQSLWNWGSDNEIGVSNPMSDRTTKGETFNVLHVKLTRNERHTNFWSYISNKGFLQLWQKLITILFNYTLSS